MSITVSHLTKYYNSQIAVDDVSFTVKKGEIVGFLGPNGAGKSTVMKILTHYIKSFDGEVWVSDIDVKKQPLEAQQKIGYLPEHNPLYLEMYVREYLSFHAEVYRVTKDRISELIDEVGLQNHAHKKIQELSKGYRQRVGLAAALLHDPEVLILDEPTTGLDPNQLAEIRALIKEVGVDKTVLFSTHIMQEVEQVCERVIILDKGKIIADESLQQLRHNKEQVIEVAFDVKVEKEIFQAVPHLKKVRNIFDTTWELSFDDAIDRRAEVFDFAQSKGLKIINLSQKNKGLEDLFKELTK